MATNGILSFVNLADTAILSVSSQAGDLGAANLADPIIQRPWRASSGSGWCQADLGSSLPIGVISLAVSRLGLMLGASDTVRLQLDNTTPGTGAVYDSGAVDSGIVPAFGSWLHYFSPIVSARYVRLTFSSANAYVQIGRLWIGVYLQPTYNIGYGWGREWSDASIITKVSKSGIRFRNPGPRFRTLTVAWNYLNPAEADAMEDGDILSGVSGQMLVCTHPDSPQRKTIIGTPKQTSPLLNPQFALYQKALTLEEDL